MLMVARSLFAVLAALSLLSACAGFSSWLRRYTYPPGFNYVTSEQLRSTMWQLARDVRELDRTVRQDGAIDETRRAEILRLLASMDEVTGRLSRQGQRSNHPIIDTNLPTFKRDIDLARKAVESTPPNYTLVGLLPGACVYCHGSAR
jgi:hypothetical protein